MQALFTTFYKKIQIYFNPKTRSDTFPVSGLFLAGIICYETIN